MAVSAPSWLRCVVVWSCLKGRTPEELEKDCDKRTTDGPHLLSSETRGEGDAQCHGTAQLQRWVTDSRSSSFRARPSKTTSVSTGSWDFTCYLFDCSNEIHKTQRPQILRGTWALISLCLLNSFKFWVLGAICKGAKNFFQSCIVRRWSSVLTRDSQSQKSVVIRGEGCLHPL